MKAKSSQVQVRRDLYLKLKVIKTAFPEANDKRMLPQSSLWPFLGHLSDIRLEKQRGPEGVVYVPGDWDKDQRFPWRGCVLPLSPGSIVAGLLPSRRQSIWLFCVLSGLLLALYFSISSLKTIRKKNKQSEDKFTHKMARNGSYFLVFIHVSTLTQDRVTGNDVSILCFPVTHVFFMSS